MPYTRRILCLAASRKPGGYCYAGKDVETRAWVRPVSARASEEISAAECALGPKGRAQVLDILDIPFVRRAPGRHQTENEFIDPTRPWKNVGEADWSEVEGALDNHDGPLWLNEEASWGFSLNRVRAQALGEITNSLVLIRPAILRVVIGPKGGLFDDAAKRRVKASFVHGGIHYMLKVTDPIAEARFLAGPDRTVVMTGSVLCISLTEVFEGYAYKLVAAVIEPPKGS